VLAIPNSPLISIQQVRIDGTVITAGTDYTQIGNNLYRVIGWGRVLGATVAVAPYMAFPPQLVEVDHTYGYTTVPDAVKGAVLETAATAYANPVAATTREQIDDYAVESAPNIGGLMLTESAAWLAEKYRTGGFA